MKRRLFSAFTALILVTILVIPATAQEARGNACPMCGENGMVYEYQYTNWVMNGSPRVCGHGDMTSTDQTFTRDVYTRYICSLCRWGGSFAKYYYETYVHCNKDGRDYPIQRTYY